MKDEYGSHILSYKKKKKSNCWILYGAWLQLCNAYGVEKLARSFLWLPGLTWA